MSTIKELVEKGQFEEALALPEAELHGRDYFFRVSALLSLGKGQEAMALLVAHRDELFAIDPVLTLRANFETRFILKQFDEAEKDYAYFSALPYVRQEVEEVLRDLPAAISSNRYATSPHKDLDSLLESLASPTDDLSLLATLGALQKVGELEDYRGLVEELLVGPWHDDVKTYALMLLSAKGSTHKTTLIKRGVTYEVEPAKLGSPYGLPQYAVARKLIECAPDASQRDVAGELLDLYCLIRFPEVPFPAGEEESVVSALYALAAEYLGQSAPALEGKAKEYKKEIGRLIKENPPLLS